MKPYELSEVLKTNVPVSFNSVLVISQVQI